MSRKTRPGPEDPGPREPSLRELREQKARAGDVDGLWDELASSHWSMIDVEDVFGHLLRAVEVRSRQDPEAFSGGAFARMVGFVGYLMLRSHYYINHRVARHGRAMRDNGPSDLPPDVAEKLLPRVLDLQAHLTELLQAQAATARSWELARAKQAENGRAGIGGGKADRQRRPAKTKPSANGHSKPPKDTASKPAKARRSGPSNGVSNGQPAPILVSEGPINRIGQLLDGRSSGTNGAHHDD